MERIARSSVRAQTSDGYPSLDLSAAVRKVLANAGVKDFEDLALDTSDEGWFSHRMRGDAERQCTAVRLEKVER